MTRNSDDIVQRLRAGSWWHDKGDFVDQDGIDALMAAAADEIERLREENHRLNARLGVYRGYLGEMGRPTKGIDG